VAKFSHLGEFFSKQQKQHENNGFGIFSPQFSKIKK
jgi:hypothetical protein